MTPEAIDCPAFPVVCTMLFSRIEARPNARRMLIESTEIGIEAATVSPAFRPTYTVTAPKMMPKSDPSRSARKVNSGRFSSGETKGSNSGTHSLQAVQSRSFKANSFEFPERGSVAASAGKSPDLRKFACRIEKENCAWRNPPEPRSVSAASAL
jgi:hypothetical protein